MHLDLPRGSMEERRQWSKRHPWLVGVYFFVMFAVPLVLLGLLTRGPGFAVFGAALAFLGGAWAVWATKTNWRPSPRTRALLNHLTSGQLDRRDPR